MFTPERIKKLVYSFFSDLSWIRQRNILLKLDLIDKDPVIHQHIDIIGDIIRKATEQGKLEMLWDEVFPDDNQRTN
jgi:hypothetical protein